jgi:glycosyltransferase involved in cell wall biosynthesis
MASGLPVISTNVGGSTELVSSGKTGCLFSPHDSHELKAKLIHYFENPDTRIEHGHNSKEAAAEKFSLSGMVQRYGELYESLVKQISIGNEN